MGLLDDHSTDLTAVFYDTARGFAESASKEDGTSVSVLFDLDYLESDAEGTVYVSSREPVARFQEDDAPTKGEYVVIRSVTYEVVEVLAGGTGETICRLHRAP